MNNSNDILKKKNQRVIDKVIYKIFGITDDDGIILENMERASKIFDRIFRERIDRVATIDAKRMNVKDSLSDENKFLANDPNTQLIQLVATTYNVECKGDSILFMRSLRAKREWIRQKYQGELTEFVLRELGRTEREFGSQESFSILIQLYALASRKEVDRDYVAGFIDSERRYKNSPTVERPIM